MADNLTAGQVEHVAKLANLPVTTIETSQFQKQLSEVVAYVGKISQVKFKKGKETGKEKWEGRPDKVWGDDYLIGEKCLTQEEAVLNTKNVHNGLFVAPAVMNNE